MTAGFEILHFENGVKIPSVLFFLKLHLKRKTSLFFTYVAVLIYVQTAMRLYMSAMRFSLGKILQVCFYQL